MPIFPKKIKSETWRGNYTFILFAQSDCKFQFGQKLFRSHLPSQAIGVITAHSGSAQIQSASGISIPTGSRNHLSHLLAGGGDLECPDWFKWGDTYYLIINWRNGFYRVSDSPTGPWERPAGPDILMPGAPRVLKTAAYHDGRRIICGWTNEHGFGGHAVFHELIRNEDGTLGEKFVPEMIPATGEPIVNLTNLADPTRTFANLPENYRLQMTLTFDKDNIDSLDAWQMVYYRDASNRDAVRLVPSEQSLYLGRTRIQEVDYTAGRVVLDLIVKNRVIDLCIDDKRTVTGVIPEFPVRELVINNRNQQYRIESLVIAPLID